MKVLSYLCRNPEPDDPNAFDAAVLLGKLCVADENARFKLLRVLNHSSDTHVKAKVTTFIALPDTDLVYVGKRIKLQNL